MLVKVKGKGVKLSGKWCFKNQEMEIDETEYEKNKDYVDIIKEDENTPEIPQIPSVDDKEEIELQELRAKAKELNIKNYHLMGKEKLEKAIAEKTAPLFGNKNTDNNTENPDETGKDDSNEDNVDEEGSGEEKENPQE